jgi:hypothetical protein
MIQYPHPFVRPSTMALNSTVMTSLVTPTKKRIKKANHVNYGLLSVLAKR